MLPSPYNSFRIAALASLLMVGALAPSYGQTAQARIDISSTASDPIDLIIEEVGNDGRADFVAGNRRTIVAHFPATTTWQEGSITVSSEKAGRIVLLPTGPWVQLNAETKLMNPVFIEYDNFQVTRTLLENGSFEEVGTLDQPKNWYKSDVPKSNPPLTPETSARVITKDAPDGKNYIRVWHNSRLGQTVVIDAKAPVKITFSYRLATTVP
ncbi:MAG: hypothetical protein WC205_15910 [Opitutaceae bacterium]|jgi:hypothetical protein